MTDDLCLFALSETRAFGRSVATSLGTELSDHAEDNFDDGEHATRPLTNVRDKDVYVVQSMYDAPELSVNDKLCRLAFFCGALRDAAAARVTAVLPYLSYQRKDRKSKPRDPVTTRYLAAMVEAVGVDRVLAMDVHNLAAFQNAFRVRTDHLEARPLLVDHVLREVGERGVVVISPDEGGVKRAHRFAKALRVRGDRAVTVAFVEKVRQDNRLTGGSLVGDVDGRVAVIVDDLISTGTTIHRATEACAREGAEEIYAVATHGVFVGNAAKNIGTDLLSRTFVTNTIPPFRLEGTKAHAKLEVCDASGRVARAIAAIHTGGSVAALNTIEEEPTST
ncbi:ribose-phosphate pyrophosphokinase [Longibacter salinarum]|uniref:ribose-phosphate diphosphokinase n=1 Tax=Longibacter salinarum TaxID=1850348 RepID=A0A2A8CX11_9BACT|nr:ribose-phosphate pyrophosphokinase [Longibacter salinarum]PEN13151.1 ribose-phosphate pyrophosphokinase [Longibacter salinarum]